MDNREHSRGLLRPQFSRAKVSDLALEENHVQYLFDRLSPDCDSWTPKIDLGPLFFNLTLDSATEFLFGQSVHSQKVSTTEGGSPLVGQDKTEELEWASFGQCFDNASLIASCRSRLMDLYFLYSPRSFQKDCQQVHKFADHFVKLALAAKPLNSDLAKGGEGKASTKKTYVFLEELVQVTRDPDEIRGQLLNILLGKQTSPSVLMLYCLAH